MGMFDDYNVFPTLKTKRVVIGTGNTVSIQGLLSTRESQQNSSTWLGGSHFTQYVKICFAVVTNLQAIAIREVYDSSDRFSVLSYTQFKDTYKTVEISLDEVLQNSNASSIAESDLESGMMINDLSFEVDLDMSQPVLPGAGYWNEENKWNTGNDDFSSWMLIGFIHFDYESFGENHTTVDRLKQLGGNCTVDTLLERLNIESGSSTWKVPETTEAFFYAETWPPGAMQSGRNTATGADRDIPIEANVGAPYFGLAYFHGSNGAYPPYEGWIGGTIRDPEPGPKLNVREVPYTKVIANGFIQAPVQGLERERYNGAQGWFYESYDDVTPLANINNMSNANTRILNMRSEVELLPDSTKKTISDFRRQVMYKEKIKNSNIMFKNTATGIKVDLVDGALGIESCHQILAYIDFMDLLTIHSPLGWLAEYHAGGDITLLRKFCDESVIKDLTITRRRVSNLPDGNNEVDVPDHTIHDTDEIPKLMVKTRDFVSSNPILASTPRLLEAFGPPHIDDGGAFDDNVEDWHCLIQDMGSINFDRGFYLEDYDLFHNVNYGKYEYTVELTILDGIKRVIEDRLKEYKRMREIISEYLGRMAIPHIPKPVVDTPRQESTYGENLLGGFSDERQPRAPRASDDYGYWDNESRSFTQRAINFADASSEKIDRFVNAFIRCYQILQKTPGLENLRISTWNQYAEFLRANLARPHPDHITNLMNFMDTVANTLDSVLGRGNISKYERITSGLLVTSLDTSKENRFIHVKAKIPDTVQAFMKSQILYEPNLLTEDPDTRPIGLRRDLWNTQGD